MYVGDCSPGFAVFFPQIMERGISTRVVGVDPVVGLVVGPEVVVGGGATFPWEIFTWLCCLVRAAMLGASTGVCAGYVGRQYSPWGQSMVAATLCCV